MDIKLGLVSAFIVIGLHANAETKAHVNLESRSGSKIIGSVDLKEVDKGLEVTYNVKGLKPGQTYGFHIHEIGDCSSKDAKSAGGHFHKVADEGGTSIDNPAAYAGDLPSLTADKKGIAKGTFTAQDLSLEKTNPVKSLAMIVHGGPDDLKMPSAPRVACGIIEVKK